ncbi:hypothetical protein TI05_01215 [Achromatium sp. WMS3]|nr:hypothetical protein TI05_01215 [Achromatium sp. WMS3]
MAYSEYKDYSKTQLEKIFKLTIRLCNIIETKNNSSNSYQEFQQKINRLAARTRIVNTNEATRIGLLVAPILVEASLIYNLGLFFEQPVELVPEHNFALPHALNGAWDSVLTLDSLDFINPIIAVVEVKPNRLSDGLGQCLAEMYAAWKKFNQNKVYGIITDGEAWEFLCLTDNQLLIHNSNCHISDVAEIIFNIGYIVQEFLQLTNH